jgi:HEAT repeat protein
MADENKLILRLAVKALLAKKTLQSVKVLIKALTEDADPIVRSIAAAALGNIPNSISS